MDFKTSIGVLFGIFTLRVAFEAFSSKRRTQLPLDLVYEIVVRLPVKFMQKLKFVSKDFNSLISSTQFEENYLMRHSSDVNLVIFERFDEHMMLRASAYYVDIHDFSEVEVNLPPTENAFSFREIGTYRGLVAFIDNVAPNPIIHLWNPSISTHISVPFVPRSHFGYYKFGLCYNRIRKEYSIVVTALSSDEVGSLAFFYVLSFSTGGITVFGEQHIPLSDIIEEEGITVDGVPHWIIRAAQPSILSFNHVENTFEMVMVRRGEYYFHGIYSLGVIQGNLSVVVRGNTPYDFEVWVTTNHRRADSWTQTIAFSIAPENHHIVENSLQPLGLTVDFVVLSGSRGRYLMMYNRSSGQLLARDLGMYRWCIAAQPTLESPSALRRG